jgi:PglZ domain
MSWRDQILSEFTPQVARLTLVADPDGLLLEEVVLQSIRERGFEIIPFEDHVAFRFAYESKYRSLWDKGDLTDLVVVLRSKAADLHALPYDLLQAGRKLSFNLGDLFPNLSYPVVAALDRSDLELLHRAQVQHKPGVLGDNATKDFILRHVFEVAAEVIKQPSDLLRVLLRRHHQGQRVPAALDERWIHVLRQTGRFEGWALEEIVPDREAFFTFLQERWQVFLDRLAGKTTSPDVGKALQFGGPLDLPFEHSDVRVYIDTLFLERSLRPIAHPCAAALAKQWAVIGISIDPQADRQRRLEGLVESVETTVPAPEAKHQDWLVFAHRWGELSALWHEAGSSIQKKLDGRFRALQGKVDANFLTWMQARFGGLHNQPAMPPVMVHHVPHAMTRDLESAGKVALVLMDGLAIEQWVVLRDILLRQIPELKMREEAVFAWVPTITPVSRQAAFAGKPPLYFASSIFTTDKDEKGWTQFWLDHGMSQSEVVYARKLGDESSLAVVDEILSHPRVKVAGLVVDKVDKIMHGMELGAAGLHQQVRQWGEQGFLAKLIDHLLAHGFTVTLTADHGNVEAIGCGRPGEGAIADTRGERVRIYPDQGLRSRVKTLFPDAIEWTPVGLPQDFFPLLAPRRSAFVTQGKRTVAHGGVCIEEVIVPLVRIGRKNG